MTTSSISQTNTQFAIHDIASAPEGSKPILEAVQKGFGGALPNLFRVMGDSPQLIAGAATLADLVGKTSLSALEQHVIELAISRVNDCDYCLAAHRFLARRLPSDVIEASATGNQISDPKLEALRVFATEMVETAGQPKAEVFNAFLEAGYSHRQALEVILVLSLKTIHNFVNNLAETPVDPFFN
jgi:AhpD family alkylhydroperoxidase